MIYNMGCSVGFSRFRLCISRDFVLHWCIMTGIIATRVGLLPCLEGLKKAEIESYQP